MTSGWLDGDRRAEESSTNAEPLGRKTLQAGAGKRLKTLRERRQAEPSLTVILPDARTRTHTHAQSDWLVAMTNRVSWEFTQRDDKEWDGGW